ncbi:zinc finger CCCH domain-containing protein 32-like [Chenopodium quinoa]|nr:zinc finger CCCH domain-containing protein 32-like [Chenopodium quinoa]XP_021764569.1 zinc finger CCCH domain-containing protein 32-like [Chenopodium quinoa]
MEEELLKRNTDCVYFLASPFTCKKGVECEYRHSEMARLNPRDCWYWMSGNCLNPTCAFRHPPLESHNEAPTDAAPPLLNQSSVSATKTTVPCYYYYNGFCNKGDRCPFLHEPGGALGLNTKMANPVDAAVHLLDSKTSGRVETELKPAEKHLIPSEMTTTSGSRLQNEQKHQAQHYATIPEPSTISKQTYIPEREETFAVKTVTLQHAERSNKSEFEPSLESDQSSEDQIDENIVRDEWCESSPGFDVLVEGETEDLVYEDDPEDMRSIDGNDGGNEHLFMPHGYAHQAEYDEKEYFGNGHYEPSEYINDELRTDLREFPSRHTQDRGTRRIVARKRNILCVETPVGGCHDVDLRDYLRKRRMVDGYLETRDLRHVRDGRQEKLQRHASNQRVHGRLASKVERPGVRLPRRRNSAVDAEQRGRPRNSQHNGYRQYNGMRSRQSLSERRTHSKRERYAQESTTVYEPKNHDAVKADRNEGHLHKNGSADFEGPKPLSEILKDKKKMS